MKDPSKRAKSALEMLSTCFGLGKAAVGRYTVNASIGSAGAFTTPVVDRGALMASRA